MSRYSILIIGFVILSNFVTAQQTGIYKDYRDGKIYKTVKIGSQIWMAENLNYATTGSCCYNDSYDYCAVYGRLYTWKAAKSACPSGWHLPSDAEWQILEKRLGILNNEIDEYGERGKYSNAGGKLKSKSSIWKYPNKGAQNTYGFNALPAGGGYGKDYYIGIKEATSFWTKTPDMGGGLVRELFFDTNTIKLNVATEKSFQSVRCIKNQ